jgi:hypothetical protein
MTICYPGSQPTLSSSPLHQHLSHPATAATSLLLPHLPALPLQQPPPPEQQQQQQQQQWMQSFNAK